MHALALLAAAMVLFSIPASAAEAGRDAFTDARKELAHRKRRIILNNDGCDALYFPKDQEPTPANFLAERTSPLAGSQVDTLFYCTISSGFSQFTHDTRAGVILNRPVADILGVEGKTNITEKLIAQGTDPLKLVVDFCHKNRMECFWSMRMNDTHDVAHRPEKPYPLFPKLKEDHPDWLVGSLTNITRNGSWSSVDYARPEIRELAFRYIEEVCRNYDVDGVELDFLRHPTFFKEVAHGGTATDAEIEMMTAFMRRVRAMAEAEGRKRGKPILIAIRVPDSVEYSKAIGLDIERWLADDLADMLIATCYAQINPWEYLVELGHRYGVTVYPGLSESRVKGEVPPYRRQSIESYRARALRAWQAGADGIYLFNFFDPKAQMLRELGDPALLRTLDRDTFLTPRDGDPGRYLAGGAKYQHIPILTPGRPLAVSPGKPQTADLYLGEEPGRGAVPAAVCHLRVTGADRLTVKLNGTPLGAGKQAGAWRDYPVDAAVLKPGLNRVEFAAAPADPNAPALEWTEVYSGAAMPKAPWQADALRKSTLAEIRDGALLVADRGDQAGDYLYYAYPWNVDAAAESVFEAQVKVISGWNNIILCNGVSYERVGLYPDHIDLYEAKVRYNMNTTDAFHTYRVVLKGSDIKVYVDGTLRLDGTGKLKAPGPADRNDVRFGAANSPSTGEALWQSVKIRSAAVSASIYDLVLSVRPRP